LQVLIHACVLQYREPILILERLFEEIIHTLYSFVEISTL